MQPQPRTKAICLRLKHLGNGMLQFKAFSFAILFQCGQPLLEPCPYLWHFEPLCSTTQSLIPMTTCEPLAEKNKPSSFSQC